MKTMKKLLSLMLTASMLSVGATSVSAKELPLADITKVNVENTDTIFAMASDTVFRSPVDYYMHFNTSGDWLEVSQNLTETAVAGGEYVISVVAKPNNGTVWFRIGWDDTGWLSSGQVDYAEDLGDGWLKYVKTVTLTANQTNFLFHNEGAATPEQLALLEKYVMMLLKDIVDDITSGDITANPYTRGSSHNACTYCPYGQVCHSEQVEGRRDYAAMKAEEFWERIRRKVIVNG